MKKLDGSLDLRRYSGGSYDVGFIPHGWTGSVAYKRCADEAALRSFLGLLNVRQSAIERAVEEARNAGCSSIDRIVVSDEQAAELGLISANAHLELHSVVGAEGL